MGNTVAYAQEWKEIVAAAKRKGSIVLRGKCPICNVRIDEYGFCSCGSSGD